MSHNKFFLTAVPFLGFVFLVMFAFLIKLLLGVAVIVGVSWLISKAIKSISAASSKPDAPIDFRRL